STWSAECNSVKLTLWASQAGAYTTTGAAPRAPRGRRACPMCQRRRRPTAGNLHSRLLPQIPQRALTEVSNALRDLDEPLRGFHWRGGDDRDTTGINLWSKPFISTLSTGERLFTEYGRLACDTDSKAFQTLLFLVRDWPNAFEHSYGFQGGSTLLNKRLQTTPKQKPELREVREHIRSCFDKMLCCLMPHPGLTVNNQFFAGCVRELTPDFRKTLLELVPSLFEPTQLVPKMVTGQRIQCQDLFDYFQKYLNIFNSDDLPEAVTILKVSFDGRTPLPLAHARGAQPYSQLQEPRAPTTSFSKRPRLTPAREALTNPERFTEKKLADSRHAYDSNRFAEHARLCLHPRDLDELHADALRQALEIFSASRDVSQDEEDIKKTDLLNRCGALTPTDETNRMDMDQTGVSSERLIAQHEDAVQLAKTAFYNMRSRPTQHANDAFMDRLLQEITTCFADMEKSNNYSNMVAMQAAEHAYNNYITRAWGPQTCCFHPRALEDLHNKAVTEVTSEILAKRPERDTTEFKAALNEARVKSGWFLIFTKRYNELKNVNVYNNEQAVVYALLVYESKRKYVRTESQSIFGFITTSIDRWMTKHEDAKRAAIAEFKTRRRGADYDPDQFYEDLLKKIEKAK
ncbi:hypothetical protein SFRURICE_007309, partial [Spodoptera frugiperda]